MRIFSIGKVESVKYCVYERRRESEIFLQIEVLLIKKFLLFLQSICIAMVLLLFPQVDTAVYLTF